MSGRISILAVFLALNGCADTCANDVVRRISSPDDRWEAVLFQRDCGATTGFSTQISIVQKGKAPTGGGNTFRADADHGKARSESWGGPWADVRWIGNEELKISYDGKSRIFATTNRVGSTKVSYAAVPR